MEASSVAVEAHAHEEHPPAVVPSAKMDSGIMGMLFFIGSEIALFGAFFMAYFFIRVVGESDFESWHTAFGEHVPVSVAAINTVILLSSSVTLHMGLNGIKKGNRKALSRWTFLTLILGLTFLSIQINEYRNLVTAEDIGPTTNAYSSIFFCLTGLHGFHVLVGATLLGIILTRSLRGHYSAEHHHGLEAMGVYWHFVDIVWVFVFSAFYLTSTTTWTNWFN